MNESDFKRIAEILAKHPRMQQILAKANQDDSSFELWLEEALRYAWDLLHGDDE